MRYIRGFRDGGAAAALARLIGAEIDPTREYHLMEFCGGHTHAIFRYGVEDLLPKSVRLVHGPGCPVCVLADAALECSDRTGPASRASRSSVMATWSECPRLGGAACSKRVRKGRTCDWCTRRSKPWISRRHIPSAKSSSLPLASKRRPRRRHT
jgi:hydrogenase expression/formation protein HypD